MTWTQRQVEIRQCVSVVVTAFNKACRGKVGRRKAMPFWKPRTRGMKVKAGRQRVRSMCAPPLESLLLIRSCLAVAAADPAAPDRIVNDGNLPGDLAAPPTPAVVSIESDADIKDLPTQGGTIQGKTLGLTIEYGLVRI